MEWLPMVLVADELKKKRAEIGMKVEEMRAQIVSLEQQAPFDVVIQTYEIGNRLSQTLDQLARAKRVCRAGKVDGHRHLWEVAA
jgi:hypothetical protein